MKLAIIFGSLTTRDYVRDIDLLHKLKPKTKF